MSTEQDARVIEAAERLAQARRDGVPCEPVRDIIPSDEIELAYAVQERLTQQALGNGRRLVGRKIGLTSLAVQKQLGVDQPDYGMLYDDMDWPLGLGIPVSNLMQPKIEAEIAFVLGQDLDSDRLTSVDMISSIDFAVAALEIVGSRVRDWDISIADTIADNASSGAFVIGHSPRRMSEIDVAGCQMAMTVAGSDGAARQVSGGSGADCMGSPVTAALWLAKVMVQAGRPLKKGDIVLSGALGPMVSVEAGQRFHAKIDGLGSVQAHFE
ncbi:2-keto-4-pentenoate hydratase [Novosphingopyxis sp.]|uniref:2-keto-4-pentenoate hydratase n=1 Tax=Novosphingopyxis sp. TaxID=2709690 RepID=UPI003B5CC694